MTGQPSPRTHCPLLFAITGNGGQETARSSFIPNDEKETINLEHVLPQKPGAGWPSFSEEDAKNAWKRIGNMVLLHAKRNSDLKSVAFSEKQRVYKESGHELTLQVAEAKDWDLNKIVGRQSLLAD